MTVTVQPALADDVRPITKFKIKAAAVSKLDHPNVVPTFAMEKADDVHLIATPRIDGRPLDQVTGDTGLLLDRISRPWDPSWLRATSSMIT